MTRSIFGIIYEYFQYSIIQNETSMALIRENREVASLEHISELLDSQVGSEQQSVEGTVASLRSAKLL